MKRSLTFVLSGLLCLAALISLAQGVRNANAYSQDFQWSPARLFASGQNPYEVWLSGNPDGAILLSQIPNYLHHLYILLAPIGLVDFATAKLLWACLGTGFGMGAGVLIARRFELSTSATLVLLGLFLASTPFRNGLGNGQQALVLTLFLYLPFVMPKLPGRFLLQGIGFAKYSFAPPFFLHTLLRHGVGPALAGLVVPALGLALFSMFTETPVMSALFQPLQVAKTSVSLGQGDLMTILAMVLGNDTLLSALPALGITLLGVVWLARVDDHTALPALAVLSLLGFKHLGYDYVVLLPVLAWAFRDLRGWRLRVATGGVVWFWFGLRLAAALGVDAGLSVLVVNHLVLWVIFFCIAPPQWALRARV